MLAHIKSRWQGVAIVALVAMLSTGGFIWYRQVVNKNPLPENIVHQLAFPAVYPKTTDQLKIDPTTVSYATTNKNLSYTANYGGTSIVVTEQPAPGDSSNPNLVYYQSLGLHPVTIIQTKPGVVVLVNFYSSGSLDPVGQDAIMAKNGTLVIAHPANKLSAETWKDFFNSLHIYK